MKMIIPFVGLACAAPTSTRTLGEEAGSGGWTARTFRPRAVVHRSF